MNIHEANHVTAKINELIDETLHERVMKAGAEGIRLALYMHLERAARAGIDAKFTAEHRQILLKFSMPAEWKQANARLEEVGARRRAIEGIVRKAVRDEG